MWRKTSFVAAIVIASGIAATSAGFAEDTPATNPVPQGQGTTGGQQGQGMMGGQQGQGMMGGQQGQGMMGGQQGQGMMGGQQGQGMMGGQQGQGMMGMMTQMSRMVENCNRMMESASNNPPAPAKPPAQGQPD